MSVVAKCTCGKSTMVFSHMKIEEIDGKWENDCCLEAPKAEKLPEEKPAPKAEPKPALKPEAPKMSSEEFTEKMKKVRKPSKKDKADEPKE